MTKKPKKTNYKNPRRVTEEEYEKSIVKVDHKLNSTGSGPVTNIAHKNIKTTELYDKNWKDLEYTTPNLSLAVAKHDNHGVVDYYYLRFNRHNELLDVYNKVHLNQFLSGVFTWLKVSKDAYDAYHSYLTVSPPRVVFYDMAKIGFMP